LAKPLEEYRRRRDFEHTPEPAPEPRPDAAAGTGFVIQRHDARALHFDLRLEVDGVLASWAVPKGPPLREGVKRLAVRTEDHPLEYLTFAGEIPPGQYGAGRMTVWDHGTYEAGLIAEREWKITLHGRRISGEYHLVRTAGRGGKDEWLMFRSTHGEPGPEDPAPRFRELRPMLASLEEAPFDDPDWDFEIKWDGYRALALVTQDGTELRSRTGRDLTGSYPSLADLRRGIFAQEAVLDGEVVVLDEEGRASFQDLQAGRGAVTYVTFDVLYADGAWVLERRLAERRELLAALLTPEGRPRIVQSDAVTGSGTALFAAAAERGVEGIVAKRRTSPYQPGRRGPDWRKVKARQEVEAVIGGFTEGERSRRGAIAALLVGRRTDEGLVYLGRVGSGFTDASGRALRRRLERMVTGECPFTEVPPVRGKVSWVRPELTARVAFTEWTDDDIMRAPSFLGLAEEEPPERPSPVLDLSRSELRVRDGGREIRLTNLDKPFWKAEGITKGDILDHYARMAPVLVPHLAGKPMVLKRYPNGWDEPFFFQHQLPETAPRWLGRVELDKGDERITYAVVNDPLELLWVVNLGCIDLNPWHATAERPDQPEYVLFDLDPQEGVAYASVVEAALLLREELDALGLRGFPKTSGSRGMHVLVPVLPGVSHETVRLFAQLVGERMRARRPDLITVEVQIARRGRRVYVDANQNGYGKTIASVYSVRPVPGASVSTPLRWEEVDEGLDPSRFTIAAVAARVAEDGDLFAPVLEDRQDLAAAIARLGGSGRG
jgi:bifunctional non-homologous end joining protein LigD